MARSKALELNVRDTVPTIDVELTDYGVRIYAIRKAGESENYVRITNFVMPNLCAIGGGTGSDGYQMDWHVPIDDTHHWKYTMAFRRSGALADRDMRDRRAGDRRRLPAGRARPRIAIMQDRDEMNRGDTFTGLGTNFLDHDGWAVETQGPIEDRTREHIATTDKAIVAARKLLLKGMEDVRRGKDPAACDTHSVRRMIFLIYSSVTKSFRARWIGRLTGDREHNSEVKPDELKMRRALPRKQ